MPKSQRTTDTERRSERIGARKIQTMNTQKTSEPEKPAPIRSTNGLERKGYDRLWLWFGLSHSGWITIPRVLAHDMPDEWQNKMAELLEEYERTYTNWPDGIGTRVQITDGNKLCPFHKWLHDYRYPAKTRIANLRSNDKSSHAGAATHK